MEDRRYHSPEIGQDQPPDRFPELELLLLCSRWPQRRREDRLLLRTRVTEKLDWQRFLLLVQHHRVVPLVAYTLQASIKEPPTEEIATVLRELRRLSGLSAHQALRSLAELRRVVQTLQAREIQVRVLKGLPLAQTVFGDFSLRAAGDLDLLIQESCITEADQLLRDLGYRGLFKLESFTPKRLAFYRAHWKDLAYENPASGFEVDLHWRCFRNREMPGSSLCDTDRSDSVSFGSFQVDTLPRLEGLLYLCVHGTLDGWLYFKSLVDVAAQVRMMKSPQLDTLADLAVQYGVLPELTAALCLVRQYLGMSQWSERLLPESDTTVAHILRYSERTLVQGGFMADREEIPISTTLAFELGLRRNFRYRFELLLRVLYRARMWESIPLPDVLFGIYPLLSPFEWLVYRLRHLGSKPPSDATAAT